MKIYKRIAVFALSVLMLVSAFACMAAFAASSDSDFEKQLAQFPRSYHPYLKELHEKYPKWKFEAFRTGVDWETAVDNEHNDYALVYNPDAARIFKSHDADDYDAENDRYYYKDGSFVAASRVAVEYFMDPRNFLDIGGIFQFELLSFSSLYTVKMVEEVLENSFMGDSKITWLDKNGKKKSSASTYAEAIFKAGKVYNINPCFLASKILNEVGSKGSESVSGDNSSYPGIYNFYNIGATDGAGAVERGLLWASGSGTGKTTYSRPWTTPEKSIMGGAEFLAEEYIAAGQFTGYLQRFNVNPRSDYELYTHQYMSNLSGALSQGYSTYRSYKEMGMLKKSITFSIPVFENMSNADGNGKLTGAESTEQYATVSRDYRYVRKGPSVDHDILTDSSGNKLFVEKGDEVLVLEKADTDAYYYEEILTYPYWYKIAFKSGSKTYTGYVPANRIEMKTTVYVAKGQTDIALARSRNVYSQVIASDPSMVKIIDGDTVNFLKNGTVKLYFYDSSGLMEEILFKVGNYKSYYSSSVKAKVSGNKVTVSSAKHEKATGYGYSLCDMSGNIIKPEFTAKTSRVFEKLADGAVYDVFAQNKYSKYNFAKAVQQPAVIKPQTVQGFDFNKDSSCNCYLFWNSVSDATGYQIMEYNEAEKEYTKVVTVPFGTNGYTLSGQQSKKADKYVVRAYSKYDGVVVYGDWSPVISLSSKAPTPSALNFSDKTTSAFTFSWTGNELCSGYEVYVATAENPEPYYYKTYTATSFRVGGFKGLTWRKYKVRSFIDTAEGRIYSDFTPLVTGLTLPSKVSGLTAVPSSSSVKLSWNAHADADFYSLYYKKGSGKYKNVKVTDTSYTLKSLSGYTDYSFYVTAVSARETASSESEACDTLTVKTLPDVPENLKVTRQGYNYIELAWDKNEALDFYTVTCYDSAGKEVAVAETTETVACIKGLSPLTAYEFKITGGKREGEASVSSDYSKAVKSETVIPIVENYTFSDVKVASLKLSWDKLEGAQYYSLYYKKDGSYKLLAKTKKTYYTVKNMPESSKGYFYLTATFPVGDKLVESEKTKTFTASVKPANVTGLTVEPTATTVLLKWDKVKNATAYRVYTVENGKYVYRKSVKGTSVRLKKLKDCAYTTVSVRACIESSVGKAYGKHVKKSFYTKPHNVTEMTQSNKTDTSYTLNWKKPSDAVNRYYIYRVDEKTGKAERIAVTKKTSYTVSKLKAGTSQSYTVMAAFVKDGKVVSKSNRVYNFSCSTYLEKPESFSVEAVAENSVTLSWSEVEGATGYRLYYYNTSKKKFILYKETKESSITVGKLPSGKEYIFRVRAIKKTKSGTLLGYNSAKLTASAK